MRQCGGDLEMATRNMIRAGFGVEDIAVKTGAHVESIRFIVRRMRAGGELARIFKPEPLPVVSVEVEE